MAFLEDEPAGERVANILADANDEGVPLLMSIINVGEVWYIVARRTSPAEADRTTQMLEQIGVRFIDAERKLTRAAAVFKAKGKISYADAFAAALTAQHKARLLTGDREFEQFESVVDIEWLQVH